MGKTTVMIDLPSDSIRLTGIVDIRNWLLNVNALPLEQFAIDWIETYVDKANSILESDGITNTDDEFCRAIHYETQTVLEVLKADARCLEFFIDLESLTRSK